MLRKGRYSLYDEIASGGMASVHFGRLSGPAGFSRILAIKRLHPHLARDPQFVTMFLDEARLAARVHHPNVVAILDVVAAEGELFLIMDYISGASLSQILRASSESGLRVPAPVATSIVCGVLHGLHAAHTARSEDGEPLDIVHRDVSPQNIFVGTDGIARVADFGVAKAAIRAQSTADGKVKGKLSYMAPEQLEGETVDHRVDVYAASVVLWEALAGRRLFLGDDPGRIVTAILRTEVPALGELVPDLPAALVAVVTRGLSRDPSARFATALEMALELQKALAAAPQHEVGECVRAHASERLEALSRRLAAIEKTPDLADRPSVDEGSPLLLSPKDIQRLSEEPTALPTVIEPRAAVTASRRGPLRWAAALVAAIALFGGAWLWTRHAPAVAAPGPTLPPTVAASSSSPAVAATPEPPLATSSAATQVASGRVAVPAPRRTTTTSGRAANCNPPYTVDGAGIKRYKPSCFP